MHAAGIPPAVRDARTAVVARITRVRAEPRAVFPGPAGRLCRLPVIGTRGHVPVVRRLPAAIRSRSEGDRSGR